MQGESGEILHPIRGRRHPADPRGAVSGALGVWDGRRVLSIGGLTEAGAAAGGAAYDPAARTWVRLAEPPGGLVEAVAVDPAGYGPGAAAVHLALAIQRRGSMTTRVGPLVTSRTMCSLPSVREA